jgi:hypothetical protein
MKAHQAEGLQHCGGLDVHLWCLQGRKAEEAQQHRIVQIDAARKHMPVAWCGGTGTVTARL